MKIKKTSTESFIKNLKRNKILSKDSKKTSKIKTIRSFGTMIGQKPEKKPEYQIVHNSSNQDTFRSTSINSELPKFGGDN